MAVTNNEANEDDVEMKALYSALCTLGTGKT